jgi:hypothetical protein
MGWIFNPGVESNESSQELFDSDANFQHWPPEAHMDDPIDEQ